MQKAKLGGENQGLQSGYAIFSEHGKQNRIMSLFIRRHKAVRQLSMVFESIVPLSSSCVEPPASI